MGDTLVSELEGELAEVGGGHLRFRRTVALLMVAWKVFLAISSTSQICFLLMVRADIALTSDTEIWFDKTTFYELKRKTAAKS